MKAIHGKAQYRNLLLLCASIALSLAIFSPMVVAQETTTERKITGYYYDPQTGKVIPKYDDLSPAASEAYLGIAKQTSGTGTSTGTGTGTSGTGTSGTNQGQNNEHGIGQGSGQGQEHGQGKGLKK